MRHNAAQFTRMSGHRERFEGLQITPQLTFRRFRFARKGTVESVLATLYRWH